MAKIKLTKNELKAQRDALKRYQRYLPTLQLKKAQLQMELRQVEHRIAEKAAEEDALKDSLAAWIRLFAEEFAFTAHLGIERLVRGTTNIAGVSVPTLQEIGFRRAPVDQIATPPWIDDGLRVVEQILRLRLELVVLREQWQRLADELRVTSQRVNLFEKVKIPESKDAIRRVRIFLGDLQTLGVARGKISKRRGVEREVAQ